MSDLKKRKISVIAAFILCFAILICVPVSVFTQSKEVSAETQKTVLSLWQIDSFEGGKGSRSSYLKSVADEFSESENCFITVTSLSSDAARLNIAEGIVPDMISYGAGAYGFENIIRGKKAYYNWCRGGYCFLTLEGDFSDITPENTVINCGIDNLYGAAALFCGIGEAQTAKPTEAYLKLINGKFKYLFGTQRDIFRLRTREATYKIKPVTEFNDLYQNISVTSADAAKSAYAEKFIKNLLLKGGGVEKLGLFYDGINIYGDDLKDMQNIAFENKITAPLSQTAREEILTAVKNKDLKKLRNLCI